MESLPKTLIEVLNSAMKENQNLSWRIHGMEDKVIMNLMWTTKTGCSKDRFANRNLENSLSSVDDGYTTMRSENSSQSLCNSVVPAKNVKISYIPKDDRNKSSDQIGMCQHNLTLLDELNSSDVSRPKEGSKEGRKQLPPIPDSEEDMAGTQKQIKTGIHGFENFKLEYSLMAEYKLLMQQKIPGCYLMPSALSPLIWYGILFMRQGLYQEGVFRFKLTIPDNFPDGECPSLVFDFPVFHPLVDPSTGELDVKRAFPKWRKNNNHVWQVLLYSRRCFYKIDTKSPWNPEASVLYEEDTDLFKKKVSETVAVSKEKSKEPVKSDDPHTIRYTPWDPNIHEDARKQMIKPKVNTVKR
ncbi:AKT-interacting protein homolog A-like isoform X2 [Mytilus galloprovincialis]|uniref:AKT-interacting protein homolog A-like isoform X2 n=1 Tax=Mytilus galloprovincialis TaxID=29158 RepID=UPI003F7C4737